MGAVSLSSFNILHLAIWLDNLLELSNNFGAPIQWTVGMMYFVLGTNLRIWKTVKYEPSKKMDECKFRVELDYLRMRLPLDGSEIWTEEYSFMVWA